MGFLSKLFGKKEKQVENVVPIVLPAQSDEIFREKDEQSLEVETVEEVQVEEISVEETLAEEIPTKEIPTVQEPVKMEETSVVTNEENIIEEKEEYLFQFAMTDENIRNKVIEFIKPITNEWDITNLQLAYGVLETKTNIFIVRTKCAQIVDEDTGDWYHTTYFTALTEMSVWNISYTVKGSKDEGEATYEVPDEYEEVLIRALEYWRNWNEHKKYENEYDKSHEKSMLRLINEYNKPLYKLIPKQEPVERKYYEIKSLEDAKALFYLCNKDTYDTMKKMCDDATIEAFNEYADKEQQVRWVVEDCEEVLNDIIAGNTDKLYKKLSFVSGICSYWLSDPNDMAETYFKACEVMFKADVYVPLQCIDSYLSYYEIRFNPLHAVPILDLVEKYLQEKYLVEYEKSTPLSIVSKIKKRCANIRCRVLETSQIDNIHNFAFVFTKTEILDDIVGFYYSRYKDMEAVKESLAEFNCVYGVQNDDIFLTAMTDESESSYYRRSFIMVDLKNKDIIEIECQQSMGKYGYCIQEKFPAEFLEVTMDAIAFFRNQPQREKFFEEYANNHDGEKLYYTKDKARKKWFATLGKTFSKLLKRIGENPLSDTLKTFVDFCENIAPEYGYQNVVVNRAATENAIEKWQQKNGICLPENYRHFLRFANGCVLGSDTTRIAGLDEIVLVNEYIKPEYMIIGSIIGDGTTLCMEKSTGEAYIEDHGEYQRVGDFKELLEYVMDLF